MAHSPEEIEELVASADAVVVNIGTLDSNSTYSMVKAVTIARELGKPVVLDPVGAGATKLRTRVALLLLSLGGISVVKGNFGEISALAGEFGKTRGVEAIACDNGRAREVAVEVARRFGTVVAVTGKVDYISNGREVYTVEPKSSVADEVIRRVTGLGCIVSALIGAYLAVEEPLKAAVAGIATFKAVAEKAAEESTYPGSFNVKLCDWLHRLDGDTLIKHAKVVYYEAE